MQVNDRWAGTEARRVTAPGARSPFILSFCISREFTRYVLSWNVAITLFGNDFVVLLRAPLSRRNYWKARERGERTFDILARIIRSP